MDSAWIPPSVRRRVGLPSRSYPVNGAGFRIRLGTDPPTEGSEPGSYEYEISERDRAVFEAAVQDARSSSEDEQRQAASRKAINDAINFIKPTLGLLRIPVAAAQGASNLVLNFLGFGVTADFDYDPLDPARISFTGRAQPGSPYVGAAGGSVVSEAAYDAESGDYRIVLTSGWAWGCYVNDDDRPDFFTITGDFRVAGTDITVSQNNVAAGFTASPVSFRNTGEEGEACGSYPTLSDLKSLGGIRSLLPLTIIEGRGQPDTQFCVRDVISGAFYGGTTEYSEWRCKRLDELAGLDTEAPAFEAFDSSGGLDPENTDFSPEELQNLIDELKGSPWYGEYGPPEEPPDPTNPDPIPRPPGGPWDPEWPCNPSGPFPPGGPDPDPPGEPPYVPPGPPGGPPIGPPVIPVPGPPVIPFPECPEDVFPGEEATLDAGGKTFKGRVRARRPSADPGMECEIEIEPPPYDDTFDKDRCYDNVLAVDIMRELAVELGMDPELLIVDPTCDVRFTGCFRKGSSKLDALWDMADLCGYGIIPDPTDPAIGPITPVPIFHGPYHEDGSLGDGSAVYEPYERTYDNIEMVHSVEYYRPNLPGLPGFSVVALVDTGPFSVPEDRVERHLAPRSMTASQAQDAADAKARDLAARGATATFVVRLDVGIAQRHQCEIRRPSRGYSIQYMVLSLRHEFDDADGGHVTVCEGRELGVTRYTPAPGTQGLPAPKFDEDGRL